MLTPKEQNFQSVDQTPALTVAERKNMFETPNTSPSLSSRGSVGGQTSPYSSASSSNRSTPEPLPRKNSPKEKDDESEVLNPNNPFNESDSDDDRQASPSPKTKITTLPNMAAENNALLIFDFDQTITNQLMYNFFLSKKYSDYHSGEKNAVTEEKIKEFLQKEDSGIKNEKKLKSVLQSAFSSGVEVAIVSFIKYIKAIEYVVKNHLDLTAEQAQSIKVVGSTAEREGRQIGKNLRVLDLLKAYKKTKGVLPQKVMLVEGNQRNIDPADDFLNNTKELLEKDKGMESILKNINPEIAEACISEEELNTIIFEGINVSSESITEADIAAGDNYLDKVEKWIKEPIQNFQGTKNTGLNHFLTPTPSYVSADNDEKSLLSSCTNSNVTLNSKRTNRFWPKAKYAMQQKGFVILGATVLALGVAAALVYFQDQEKFIAFFTNSPLYITIPIIVVASLVAIGAIFCLIKQICNTKECQIQEKNADKALDKVLEFQPEDKIIKSVRLEYSNNTHSNFTFNTWQSRRGFINIDEKATSKTNKIKSIFNDRPLFTALLTGFVVANVALPLGLLATNGVNGVQKLYQNPLANYIVLSLLIGLGVLALSTLCLYVHYSNKTNCTNLIYPQEEIDTKSINEKFIKEIKQERTDVLKDSHSKDGKRQSLTLEKVVVESHNCPDAVYSVS